MSGRITELFNNNVFTDAEMKARLPKKVYNEVKACKLDKGSADIVAQAVRDWAIEKGATHFTHVFEPLTMLTAEKHDSFVSLPDEDGKVMMDFTGKELCESEPDGSSFPSGGIRDTSRARSYTSWDMTSPIYVKEDAIGTILCIPAAFCSYTGEALDAKTPLLRSMDAVSEQGVRLLRLLGNTTSTKVTAGVGPEQEYFIVDRDKYLQRDDLVFTGRTLFGAPAPKGQELDDQYFGVIQERVGSFMKELNEELWRFGITAKTQHNEVAPGQHEVAPIFSVTNVAADSNLLLMDTLKKVATRHGLVCLLHEKPFAGVNGSGKHNNWSLSTDDGINLFKPSKKPETDTRFQLVVGCVMKAVKKHALLLRTAASNPGNDHRLGANEAPPAIISIFLGDQIGGVVDQIIEKGYADSSIPAGMLDLGVKECPAVDKDPTDRNRTSPFAFTGNRFEFRMVASSCNVAEPNIVLNAMMAEAFSDAADAIEAKLREGKHTDVAIREVTAEFIRENKDIYFNGNGYTDEWVAEAERRGLPNVKTWVDSIKSVTEPTTVEMYEKFHILTKRELEARAEVFYETYSKTLNIEAGTMIDMVTKKIIPAVIKYENNLAASVNTIKSAYAAANISTQEGMLHEIAELLGETYKALKKLSDVHAKAVAMEGKEQAFYYKDVVKEAMDELRAPVDKLEVLVERKVWPMPTYGDLLFEI